MSWDETAVLIAAYGPEKCFDIRKGNIIVRSDGSDTWEDSPASKQGYVVMKTPEDQLEKFIEEMMMHQPLTNRNK